MSAKDKLREGLRERGESWHKWPDEDSTTWQAYSNPHTATESMDGTLIVTGLTPAQAIDATLGYQITEDTSDGWHSFKDLYHHRALLFSVIVHNYKDMCWKSKRHHDGKELDWNFIVGIDTPWGQASYHYGMDYWDMFDCKVLERAPYYDGYTADESVARIARLVELELSPLGVGTCHITPKFTCSECGHQYPTRNYESYETCDGRTAFAPLGHYVLDCKKPNFCPNCGRRVVEVDE